MTELNLQKIREDIDRIDTQLVELFRERMEKSIQVAQYKQAHGLPILNSAREQEVLNKVTEQMSEPFGEYAKYLFNNPSNALPCLASSRAISCTVSWIASRFSSFTKSSRTISNFAIEVSFSSGHSPKLVMERIYSFIAGILDSSTFFILANTLSLTKSPITKAIKEAREM